jgi:endonuclease-8
MRIVIGTAQYEAVAFKVPIAEFHTEKSLRERENFNQLGPDVLAAGFDEQQAAANLRSFPDLEVGEALLRQHVLAGIGNVFKSEVCFACRVNPFRRVSSLNEAEIECLMSTARKFLRANVADSAGNQIVTYAGFRRTTRRADPEQGLWVYGRRGEPCRRCGTAIECRKTGAGARVTFWCPGCQR